MKNPARRSVQAGVKTILRSTTAAVLGALGLVSCATDPYYAGNTGYYDNSGYYGSSGYPSATNAAPLIATGIAIAALAGYANERQSRHDMKRALAYQNAYYGHPGYGHRPPPPPPHRPYYR